MSVDSSSRIVAIARECCTDSLLYTYSSQVTKMAFNASNSAQRQAASTTNCDDEFSSASKLAEELEQNIDVLRLDQDLCQSHYADNQSPGEDRHGRQTYPQGEADFHDFQPLCLD